MGIWSSLRVLSPTNCPGAYADLKRRANPEATSPNDHAGLGSRHHLGEKDRRGHGEGEDVCDSWDRAVGQCTSQVHRYTLKTGCRSAQVGFATWKQLGNRGPTEHNDCQFLLSSYYLQFLQFLCAVPNLCRVDLLLKTSFPEYCTRIETAQISPWEASRLPDLQNGQCTP